jgi:hypothetical protein
MFVTSTTELLRALPDEVCETVSRSEIGARNEGYPDASNKEGEPWGLIPRPLSRSIRQNCEMQ